jgi:membrane peptidoglycan carboxypeptidase
MSVLEATAKSVNTAFVAMEEQLELCQIASTASSLGVHMASPRPDYVSAGCSKNPTDIPDCIMATTLGPFDIAPLTMASAYATFAADGTYCPPFPVLSIKAPDKSNIPIKAPSCRADAIDPDVAHGVTYALKGVIDHGTATDVKGEINVPVAGKTGTTDNSVDTWFVGYTHQRTTAVWVGDNPAISGNGKRKSLNYRTIGGHHYDGPVFGATIAAPIWAQIMKVAVPGTNTDDWPDPPSSMLGRSTKGGIPDVSNMSVAAAISTLAAAGFNPRVGSAANSDVPVGLVASTSPGAGASADPGSTVTIHPSTGNGGGNGNGNPAPNPKKKRKRPGG